uniref:Uncharacterized protein n=2 Tax=Guillardia theta TaxID=55529 RepID=A0A7S4L5B7_GUITH|mmetsp:Transcript_37211/g.117105  ORF Transcript_37211/g.117105 Transcript_37211/m.117105 type:complete len:360 (+) Transcript_37211:169-1248(+)
MWRPPPAQSAAPPSMRMDGLKFDGLEVNGLSIACKPCHRQVTRSKSLTSGYRDRDALVRKPSPATPAMSIRGNPKTADERDVMGVMLSMMSHEIASSRLVQKTEEDADVAQRSNPQSQQIAAVPLPSQQHQDKRTVFPPLKRSSSVERESASALKPSKSAMQRLKEDPLPPTNILGGDFELAGAQHLIRMKKSHKTHFRGDLSKKPAATLFLVGGNKSVKDEARSRGIKVMQQQEDSNAFDLKWTLGHADIDFGKLASSQFVNHFPGTASELGAKVGLNRNLKSLRWFDGMEVDSFFPRMYNLYNPWELQDFIEDFIFTAAAVEIKREMLGMELTDPAAKTSQERKYDILESATHICMR